MFRESQTGIKHFEAGDKVSLGKGKVIYTVLSDVTGHEAHVESTNTGKASTVDAGRLVLFLNVRDTDEWKEANEAKEEPVKETSAYAKAVLFALNKLQKHVYAGTVSEKTKGKRRGLGRRQKASRKANR